ncbi:hypothetical protein GXM_04996 [Nostoc sphaeroides CCNUC1]|uniref:Uncharacterized protein n=1 Tax=Nostoc sphaeroides CCNUC1 TaxID=2653204 RepID=A0A5P8W4D8_9NOSO|nr:hypothetical protein GXM_04996 [Nostoc sphaeroides CCNUC1]
MPLILTLIYIFTLFTIVKILAIAWGCLGILSPAILTELLVGSFFMKFY